MAETPDKVRRLPMPSADEVRVINEICKRSSLKFTKASWVLFGSQNLVAAEVLQYKDDLILMGPYFENYLIEKSMGEQHHRYLMMVREGLHVPPEVKEQEFSLGLFDEMFESSPTVLGKVEILKQAVLRIISELDEVGLTLQDMHQREFYGREADADGGKEQESLPGPAES